MVRNWRVFLAIITAIGLMELGHMLFTSFITQEWNFEGVSIVVPSDVMIWFGWAGLIGLSVYFSPKFEKMNRGVAIVVAWLANIIWLGIGLISLQAAFGQGEYGFGGAGAINLYLRLFPQEFLMMMVITAGLAAFLRLAIDRARPPRWWTDLASSFSRQRDIEPRPPETEVEATEPERRLRALG